MNNTTERSTILLVVLGIDAPSGSSARINVSLLQEVFGMFGTLHKIIIFLKESIVKAFLEYALPENAAEARTFLHNCSYNDLGRIKVFFSALQRLEFSSRYVECKDLVPNKPLPPAKLATITTHKAKVLLSENLSNQKTPAALVRKAQKTAEKKVLSVKKDFNNLDSKENSHVNSPSIDVSQIVQSQAEPSGPKPVPFAEVSRPRLESIHEVVVDDPILTPLPTEDALGDLQLSSQTSLPASAPTMSSLPSGCKLDDLRPSDTLNSTAVEVDPLKAGADSPNTAKVVLISNLDDFFFTASEIFNLFSCFGNIVRVLLMKNLKKALVEYKKPESAEVAVNCMNNRSFGRSKIKVVFSKYKKIDLKRNNKSENSQNFNEVIIVSNKMNRFKNSAPHIIAPTDTLLVLVEKAEDLQLSDVMLSVQLFGKPSRIKTMNEPKENADVELHQVLFKFSSTMMAMKVLAQAHNSEVNGHFLNVTFAASMTN